MRTMSRLGFCFPALVLLGLPLWSQQPDTHGLQRPGFSFYAGYSLVTPNFYKGFGNRFGPESGYNLGIDVGVVKKVALVADFSQYDDNYGSVHNTNPFVLLMGPRFYVPLKKDQRVKPFADFLVGSAHVQSDSSPFTNSASFAWSAGGGLDLKVSGHFWIRGQASYLHTGFTTDANQFPQYAPPGRTRIVVGIVYRH